MQVIFDTAVHEHAGSVELTGGRFVPCFENPARSKALLDGLRAAGHGMAPARRHGLEPVRAVHHPGMVAFLEQAWELWLAETGGEERDALPIVWPARGMPRREPRAMVGRLGFWCFDAGTPITAGAWTSARASVDCALTAVDEVLGGGDGFAFAACRPPGHHAGSDHFGGYCYLNASAVAAQAAVDRGAERVAVVDVDDHHGNGTQEIFEARGDVLTVSLHGDPDVSYPYFTGRADEVGTGPGEGCNANYPIAKGAGWPAFSDALGHALARVERFGPEFVVVPLGVDTFVDDPIGARVGLGRDDLERTGRLLAERLPRVPVVVVMEGGYAVESLAENVDAVLRGFESAR